MTTRPSLLICAIACGLAFGCGGGDGNRTGSNPTDAGAKDVGGGAASDAARDQTSATDGGPTFSNACSDFVPCAGDLVGTWLLISECFSLSSQSGSCGTSIVAADITGYWARFVFNADKTFSFSLTGKTDVTTRYAPDCLVSASTPAQECATLQSTMSQYFQGAADAGPTSFTVDKFACSMQSDACLCEEVVDRAEFTETGTYTTAGSQLFLNVATPDGGPSNTGSDPTDYCVSGNTLTIPTTSHDGFMTFSR